jgi:hypothetical protein
MNREGQGDGIRVTVFATAIIGPFMMSRPPAMFDNE